MSKAFDNLKVRAELDEAEIHRERAEIIRLKGLLREIGVSEEEINTALTPATAAEPQ
ncbi:MAG: hypothetical protein J6D38_07350 [Solobacterium sp.]|nr:hypothetical protein [Solobacterium sp.]